MISARDARYLRYISDSITMVAKRTAAGEATFRADVEVQDAVLRRLETLADAASKLPEELQARHPEANSRRAWSFRNVAAHAYEGIDILRISEIVENYLPALKGAVEDELRRTEAAGGDTPAAT